MLEELRNHLQTQESARFETNKKDERMDEKEAVAMAKAIYSQSWTQYLLPSRFAVRGRSELDTVFELYCKHRGLNPAERATLFPLMMRDGAADWLATLSNTQPRIVTIA